MGKPSLVKECGPKKDGKPAAKRPNRRRAAGEGTENSAPKKKVNTLDRYLKITIATDIFEKPQPDTDREDNDDVSSPPAAAVEPNSASSQPDIDVSFVLQETTNTGVNEDGSDSLVPDENHDVQIVEDEAHDVQIEEEPSSAPPMILTEAGIVMEVCSDDLQQETDVAAAVSLRPLSPLGEGEYEVEEVLGFKEQLYEIKWRGYEEADNTWEPLSNLSSCGEKLEEFFLKKRLEYMESMASLGKGGSSASAEKKRKEANKLKLSVPPDPRSLEVRIDEFLDKGHQATGDELNAVYRKLKSGKVFKKDRWTKVKVEKFLELAFYDSLNQEDTASLRTQVLYWKVELKVKTIKEKLQEWAATMNNMTKGKPHITVENEVDLSAPPEDFTYINDYLPADGIEIPDDPPVGCHCDTNCVGQKAMCCPKTNTSHSSFYTNRKYAELKVPAGIPIYECNKACKCTSDCGNRVVRDGITPLQGKKFCVYMTSDCGWGVKTLTNITRGTYVCLYVGEIIPTAEAEKRGREYDEDGTTYLFDLDFNEGDDEECPYTVDAKRFGNISHFMNHSCDPNLGVWGTWVNCLDVNLPKLALFALRDIPKNSELTFDYKCNKPNSDANVKPREADDNVPLIKTRECRCGSANCRKYLF